MAEDKNTSKTSNNPVDEILNSKNTQEIQEIIFHQHVIHYNIPEEKPEKRVPAENEYNTGQGVKYIRTRKYKIFLAVLVLLGLSVTLNNLGLYVYLSVPWIYKFYQAVVTNPNFWLAIIILIIPAIGAWGLSWMKNKKGFDPKDILVYCGTFVTILFIICTVELMIYNFPKGIENNDYLNCLYRANEGNTRIPGFLLPIRTSGVKIDNLEEKFLFDYDENYKLILTDNQKKIRIDHSLISADFLDANQKEFIEIFGKYFVEKQHIHRFLGSGGIYGNFFTSQPGLSDEEITALLIVQFIKDQFAVISQWVPPSGGKFEKIFKAVKEGL